MSTSTIPGSTTECTPACPSRRHAHVTWGSPDRGEWFHAVAIKHASLSRVRTYLDDAFGDTPDFLDPEVMMFDAQRDGHTIRLTLARG